MQPLPANLSEEQRRDLPGMVAEGAGNLRAATLVELVNGEIVTSCAEAWRMECEARAILNLPTLEQRCAWLADLETRRGTAAVDALRATMQQLHAAQKAAA